MRCFALCFSCVHAPKLLPRVSLGARARPVRRVRFFLVCFLRAKNHESRASRTGPHLKENFRKINDFIVFNSIQGVNSTFTSSRDRLAREGPARRAAGVAPAARRRSVVEHRPSPNTCRRQRRFVTCLFFVISFLSFLFYYVKKSRTRGSRSAPYCNKAGKFSRNTIK